MKILRKKDTRAVAGHGCDASLYNQVRAGLFPKPVRIGQRAVGWPDFEVEAIVAARIGGASDADVRALVERLHAQRQKLAALAACTSTPMAGMSSALGSGAA